MAGDNKVRAIDIGESWWQDVDTPANAATCRETDGQRDAKRADLGWLITAELGACGRLRSRLARYNIATTITRPDHGDCAEDQARAGDNRPKIKDPVSQAE